MQVREAVDAHAGRVEPVEPAGQQDRGIGIGHVELVGQPVRRRRDVGQRQPVLAGAHHLQRRHLQGHQERVVADLAGVVLAPVALDDDREAVDEAAHDEDSVLVADDVAPLDVGELHVSPSTRG